MSDKLEATRKLIASVMPDTNTGARITMKIGPGKEGTHGAYCWNGLRFTADEVVAIVDALRTPTPEQAGEVERLREGLLEIIRQNQIPTSQMYRNAPEGETLNGSYAKIAHLTLLRADQARPVSIPPAPSQLVTAYDASVAQPTADAVERVKAQAQLAAWHAIYGENADPFANPEGYDFCSTVAVAILAALPTTMAGDYVKLDDDGYLWKWVERGLFDANHTAHTALECIAHHPDAPWKKGRWDVDHKPYAAKFYAAFPAAASPTGGE